MVKYYLIIMLIMSLITLIIYKIDKEKAKKNKYRIKESLLLFLSFFFGSIGGIIGMYCIRHKNKHIKFIITNWLFLFIHIIIGYILFINS